MAISGLTRGVPADLIAPYGSITRPGGNGPGIDRALQIYLPEIFPIPAASEFNVLATKQTTGPETSIDIGLSVQIPPNNIAIIRSVVFNISDMLTTTAITFTLLANNGPVAGYSNVSIFPRVAPFVSNAFDSFIRVDQGQTIKCNYTNPAGDGGTYTLGVSVGGWWWPKALGDLWMQSGGQITAG